MGRPRTRWIDKIRNNKESKEIHGKRKWEDRDGQRIDYRFDCEVDRYLQKRLQNDDKQGPDFDDMSSFFPCEIDDAIQYINLGYGAQAPKIVFRSAFFHHFLLFSRFRSFL